MEAISYFDCQRLNIWAIVESNLIYALDFYITLMTYKVDIICEVYIFFHPIFPYVIIGAVSSNPLLSSPLYILLYIHFLVELICSQSFSEEDTLLRSFYVSDTVLKVLHVFSYLIIRDAYCYHHPSYG